MHLPMFVLRNRNTANWLDGQLAVFFVDKGSESYVEESRGGSLTGLGQIRFQCMITLIGKQHRGGDVPIWRQTDQEAGQGKGKRISVDGEKEYYC